MECIVLNNRKHNERFLIPCDNINYIKQTEFDTEVILKSPMGQLIAIHVDEPVSEIWEKV